MIDHGHNHLARLRYAELCSIRPFFPDGARVLEIGGGNGYQAAVLNSWGMEVMSIDIDAHSAWTERYFDVVDYDGKTIPVADGKVDVVFSSNVLEHIPEDALQKLFTEMRRVLAPGGIAVHLMPTPVWRLWTIATHYPWLVRCLIWGAPSGTGIAPPSVTAAAKRRGLTGLLKRALWPAAHGEYPGSLAELFAFRERAWRQRFAVGGFTVQHCYPAGIFYTGYALLPQLSISWRRFLSKLLGSACKIYVLKTAAPSGDKNASL